MNSLNTRDRSKTEVQNKRAQRRKRKLVMGKLTDIKDNMQSFYVKTEKAFYAKSKPEKTAILAVAFASEVLLATTLMQLPVSEFKNSISVGDTASKIVANVKNNAMVITSFFNSKERDTSSLDKLDKNVPIIADKTVTRNSSVIPDIKHEKLKSALDKLSPNASDQDFFDVVDEALGLERGTDAYEKFLKWSSVRNDVMSPDKEPTLDDYKKLVDAKSSWLQSEQKRIDNFRENSEFLTPDELNKECGLMKQNVRDLAHSMIARDRAKQIISSRSPNSASASAFVDPHSITGN